MHHLPQIFKPSEARHRKPVYKLFLNTFTVPYKRSNFPDPRYAAHTYSRDPPHRLIRGILLHETSKEQQRLSFFKSLNLHRVSRQRNDP